MCIRDRNIITQSIGQAAPVEPDLGIKVLEKDDYLVINSDGLTNMISNDEIVEILGRELSLDEKNQEMINLANLRGGLDNITIALVHNESEDVE